MIFYLNYKIDKQFHFSFFNLKSHLFFSMFLDQNYLEIFKQTLLPMAPESLKALKMLFFCLSFIYGAIC